MSMSSKREATAKLNALGSKRDLCFFYRLRCQRSTPYYRIPSIHPENDDVFTANDTVSNGPTPCPQTTT